MQQGISDPVQHLKMQMLFKRLDANEDGMIDQVKHLTFVLFHVFQTSVIRENDCPDGVHNFNNKGAAT